MFDSLTVAITLETVDGCDGIVCVLQEIHDIGKGGRYFAYFALAFLEAGYLHTPILSRRCISATKKRIIVGSQKAGEQFSVQDCMQGVMHACISYRYKWRIKYAIRVQRVPELDPLLSRKGAVNKSPLTIPQGQSPMRQSHSTP